MLRRPASRSRRRAVSGRCTRRGRSVALSLRPSSHIADVVHLIEFEDVHDVVLLGHSYGGLVVTGAADRISERIS
jgi:pimeloyl-ACP methyl ester carboxylesterase